MTKSKPTAKQGKTKQAKKSQKPSAPISTSMMAWGILGAILLLTLIMYWPALGNEFVWDDLVYIQKNPLIYSLDLPNIFSSYLAGNYHPITVLGHALEYHFFGFEENGYHTVNVLLHVFNTALVFFFIRNVSGNDWIGLIASLFFGIHPMHVESVAWVSELKDLLYTFFFLAALIAYVRFTDRKAVKWYIVALVMFLLSLLSKGMAVSLPVVLVLIDIYKGRLSSGKVWMEKIPFFILSFVFGFIAIKAQQSESALHADVIPLMQRIIFACYGYITYIQKLVFPTGLSAYYPYPVGVHDAIPAQYYLHLLLALVIAGLTWYSLRSTKKILLGIGFFTITVFLVLKLLPVGYAVMADRYSYVPSIGIFFLAAEGLYWLFNKPGNALYKPLAITLLTASVAFYGYSTFQRCKVWENGYTLWTDTIEKNNSVYLAFLNRGVYLVDQKKYDEAEKDLDQALRLNPEYADAFYNRGIVYQNTQRRDLALADYNKAIALDPSNVKSYVNRGNIWRDKNQNDLALADYTKAIALDPGVTEAYNNKGILHQNQGQYDEAIKEYSRAIQMVPTYVNAYINRGNAYSQLNRFEEAMGDYQKAIQINPNNGLSYYARGLLSIKTGSKPQACDDFQKAVSLGYGGANEALKFHCQ